MNISFSLTKKEKEKFEKIYNDFNKNKEDGVHYTKSMFFLMLVTFFEKNNKKPLN